MRVLQLFYPDRTLKLCSLFCFSEKYLYEKTGWDAI